ncbi:MAG: DUF2085 domain-containing protein [Thermomicrobiaceae bacterium]
MAETEIQVTPRHWYADRRVWLFCTVIAASIGAFLVAPWSLQEKSIAALHGLCAQQPTHSFWFGDSRLPFDARMTGIYGGFLIVGLYQFARGRLYHTGTPPASLLIMLACFVAIMGFDGVNSTLNDHGLPHVYEPSNHLRFFTGAGTGTAMAVFIWLIAGGVLWSPEIASTRPILRGPKELLSIGALVTMFWAVLQINAPILFPPIAVFLVIAAVFVVASMALVTIRLAGGAFQQANRPADLARSAVVAVVVAYAVMSAISGARFMLEAAVVA